MDEEVLEWVALARRLRDVNNSRFRELLAALDDIVNAEEAIAQICPGCGGRQRHGSA